MPAYKLFTDARPSSALDLRFSLTEVEATATLLPRSNLSPHAARFSNPIARGADPWVVQHAGHYYFCEPVTDNSVAIWKTDCFTRRGARKIVWKAPTHGWNSNLLWAPELHRLDGRWFIYYAASAALRDNSSHRIGVLESVADDPLGPYLDRGMLYTGDDPLGRTDNCWAIDATILEMRGGRYVLWSGWPAGEDLQYLYIAQLANPWTTIGSRVRLCDNATYAWERVNDDPCERGLHEAPQVLKHGGRVFVVYSCSASWQQTYKLGLLELAGDDPLNAASWRKHSQPVFRSSDEVFGVGHASFVKSPDGLEDWIIYHAKISRTPGWRRVICAQRFTWRSDGLPDFGQPAAWHVPLESPSGAASVTFPQVGVGNGVTPGRGNSRCLRVQAVNSVHPRLNHARYAWRFGQCPCDAPVTFSGETTFRDCALCRAASTGA
jgi:GH43 family beta-xylosidase